jgi:hypothetical protein
MREISPARLPLDGKLIRFENHLFASEPCAARDFDRIALATRYSPHDASIVSPVVRNKKSGGQAPAFPFPFETCRESIPPMRILSNVSESMRKRWKQRSGSTKACRELLANGGRKSLCRFARRIRRLAFVARRLGNRWPAQRHGGQESHRAPCGWACG